MGQSVVSIELVLFYERLSAVYIHLWQILICRPAVTAVAASVAASVPPSPSISSF
jgi:hypothetical protein